MRFLELFGVLLFGIGFELCALAERLAADAFELGPHLIGEAKECAGSEGVRCKLVARDEQFRRALPAFSDQQMFDDFALSEHNATTSENPS